MSTPTDPALIITLYRSRPHVIGLGTKAYYITPQQAALIRALADTYPCPTTHAQIVGDALCPPARVYGAIARLRARLRRARPELRWCISHRDAYTLTDAHVQIIRAP